MKIKYIGVAAIAVVALAGCSSTSTSTPSASPTMSSSASSTAMPTGDIVAVASANPTTTTLAAALDAAGLVTTLEGPGPFTVFAPTNDAFAALPAGVLDKLLQPANKATLQKILKYHVVPSKVTSAEITTGDVATVEGATVAVSTANGEVTVNGAKVTTPDIPATNGVIHLIDTVLLPPGVDVTTLK